jgi:hypothetical protein
LGDIIVGFNDMMKSISIFLDNIPTTDLNQVRAWMTPLGWMTHLAG